jgi:enoyl-CoA hydratase/carnithine racemase
VRTIRLVVEGPLARVPLDRPDALFVAGINGHCLGGDLQLALVCDYRLASGAARARELILLGEPIDARTAERYGLVNRAAPAADFERPFDAFRREMQAHVKVCLDSDEHRRAMDEIRARRRAQKGAPS